MICPDDWPRMQITQENESKGVIGCVLVPNGMRPTYYSNVSIKNVCIVNVNFGVKIMGFK